MDTIQIRYDEIERITHAAEDQAALVRSNIRNLANILSRLQAGGWEGDAATYFFNDMNNDVFPALERLTTALDQTSITLQQIARTFQEAEAEAAGFFSKDHEASGTGGFIGGRVHQAVSNAGYSTTGGDGSLHGASPASKQAIFVNGIQTDLNGHVDNLDALQGVIGDGVPVMGIYNATGGKYDTEQALRDLGEAGESLGKFDLFNRSTWGESIGGAISNSADAIESLAGGFIEDIVQSGNDIAEGVIGERLDTNLAVDQLERQIIDHFEVYGNDSLQLFAHSQGGAITSAALNRIAENHPDLLRMIEVNTFGSAGVRFPDGPSYNHFRFKHDPIGLLTDAGNDVTVFESDSYTHGWQEYMDAYQAHINNTDSTGGW